MSNTIDRSEVGRHVRLVAQGGGMFVGYFEHLVLFNSPATGSTLSIPENLLTSEAVAAKLVESNKQFGK